MNGADSWIDPRFGEANFTCGRRPAGTAARPDGDRTRLRGLSDLMGRETIVEDASVTFHSLPKNACCYLVEMGLADTEVGGILGMSPEMVRHYSKRAKALMIARGAADRVTRGKITPLPGVALISALEKNG